MSKNAYVVWCSQLGVRGDSMKSKHLAFGNMHRVKMVSWASGGKRRMRRVGGRKAGEGGKKRPNRRRQWQPTPVLSPGKSHGRRSLVSCSPGGREESDTTERLHFHFSLSCVGEGNSNPLQCSCLENPRDSGAWWAAVYGVAQSRTRLKRLSSSSRLRKGQFERVSVVEWTCGTFSFIILWYSKAV